jgi:hypothetical protein
MRYDVEENVRIAFDTKVKTPISGDTGLPPCIVVSGSIMASATPTAQVLSILVLVLVIVLTRTSTRKRQKLFHAVRPHVANPVLKTVVSLGSQ